MIWLWIYLAGFALVLWSFKVQHGSLEWRDVVLSALWCIWIPGTFVLWAILAVWISMAEPEAKAD